VASIKIKGRGQAKKGKGTPAAKKDNARRKKMKKNQKGDYEKSKTQIHRGVQFGAQNSRKIVAQKESRGEISMQTHQHKKGEGKRLQPVSGEPLKG